MSLWLLIAILGLVYALAESRRVGRALDAERYRRAIRDRERAVAEHHRANVRAECAPVSEFGPPTPGLFCAGGPHVEAFCTLERACERVAEAWRRASDALGAGPSEQ